MFSLSELEPVEYLVFGHITVDQTPAGAVLGGSAAYAALTARALGLRVGVVTVRGAELPLSELEGIPVISGTAEHSSTFENLYTPAGRIQYLRHLAPPLPYDLTPQAWRRAKIMHLAPVAAELSPTLPEDFHPALLALTPQGWLRQWDSSGRVSRCEWQAAPQALARAGAAVLSVEDVAQDEEYIETLAHSARLLAVTEGAAGARIFWNGDSRRFRAPQAQEVDATGAGDIFAAAFFVRLYQTRDPWEAARFANRIASFSVTRPGLQGVPTQAEVQSAYLEVIG